MRSHHDRYARPSLHAHVDPRLAGGWGHTRRRSADRPAASAILFDEPNFSDNGPAQGVAGEGCQNVARPKVTSSISASGSLKIWSGRGCTGESKVVNGDVADLSTIGFDNKITSVKFG